MKKHFILIFGAVILLTGCSSYRSYKELRRAYSENQYSDFYFEEVSRVDTILPPSDDMFLNDIQEKLLAYRQSWQKKLEDTSANDLQITDFTPEELSSTKSASENEVLNELGNKVELRNILSFAYHRNPKIKAARAHVRAAVERYPQAVHLDTILQQYNAFTRELNTLVGPMNHKEMVAMKFPSPDVLSLKGKVIDEDVFIAVKKYQAAQRDVLAELKVTFFNYEYLRNALAINRENQKLIEQVIKIAQSKYKSDRAKYASVILAQVELARISNSIITLEQKLSTAMAKINTILDLPTESPLGNTAEYPLEEITSAPTEVNTFALNHRQEILIQASALNRMKLMLDMTKRMTYPDATLGNSYFEDRMRPASKNRPGETFKTTGVLSQRQSADLGRSDAYVREITQQTGAMEKQLKNLMNQTSFLVKKELFELDAHRRSLKLHRTVLVPQSTQALKATETGYKAGKIGFITYLDAQRTLLKIQLGQAEARRNFQSSLAKLDQLAGGVLKKKLYKKDK